VASSPSTTPEKSTPIPPRYVIRPPFQCVYTSLLPDFAGYVVCVPHLHGYRVFVSFFLWPCCSRTLHTLDQLLFPTHFWRFAQRHFELVCTSDLPRFVSLWSISGSGLCLCGLFRVTGCARRICSVLCLRSISGARVCTSDLLWFVPMRSISGARACTSDLLWFVPLRSISGARACTSDLLWFV